MRVIVLPVLFVFQILTHVCIFVRSSTGNNVELRYSQCQLGRGSCKKNIVNYSKKTFSNQNALPRHTQMHVEINGKNVYWNATPNIDRFTQAKIFCDKYKICKK